MHVASGALWILRRRLLQRRLRRRSNISRMKWRNGDIPTGTGEGIKPLRFMNFVGIRQFEYSQADC